jgi:outer membrane murein-binding lipoprotein Lpp
MMAGILLSGCAANSPFAGAPADKCSAQVARLNAQLEAQAAEQQRSTRAAARREEALRRQLEAMKAIERGILEREDRLHSESK